MYNGIEIIGEVKKRSPFGFESSHSLEELFEIADSLPEVDMIAIHTHEDFGGAFEHITWAKKRTQKPILAKGYHETDDLLDRTFDAGADLALVVGRRPRKYRKNLLIEPRTFSDLIFMSVYLPRHIKIVWNRRDLITGRPKPETFLQARTKWPVGWLCQASFIQSVEDMDPSADAVLVGTHLPEFAESIRIAKQKT